MRKRTITSSASALLLFIASFVSAKHGVHENLEAIHKRHRVNREIAARSTAEDAELGVEIRAIPETTTDGAGLDKRQAQCAFPTDAGLVSVTPGDANAGWAMSPDQPCTPGNYCPYACPAGQVSMQWDPTATSYSYPKSMNGGLFCDANGNIQKPFPDRPYCQSTATNIGVQNNAGGVVAFCQTVLPGNEAMLIPTSVTNYATLAVPDPNYWCGTAAHYYINPPGISTDQACVWGTNSNPFGNWSPYVAGANVDGSGQTFIKLGWNPIYLEPATPFRTQMPNWGVKIDCPNGGCNGLPCAIDPTQNQVNQMMGSASNGAGGGAFCVVTVEKGATANFVVYNAGGSTSSGGNGGAGGWGGSSSGSGSGGGSGSTSSGSGQGSWSSPSAGRPGQFYQSSAGEPAPSTAPESSSEAPATSEETTTTTTSPSAPASSSTHQSTVASSSWDASSKASSSKRPVHSPYFSSMNQTSTAAPTAGSTEAATFEATATPVGPPSSTQPPVQVATGAASALQGSLSTILFGMVICLFANI